MVDLTLRERYTLGCVFPKPTVLRFKDRWVFLGPGLYHMGVDCTDPADVESAYRFYYGERKVGKR